MKIYLDACCFNRPFDEQRSDRIIFETNAIILIFRRIDSGELDLMGSDVLVDEIEQTPLIKKRLKLFELLNKVNLYIALNNDIINRGKELEMYKLKPHDALHIASAEFGNADIFLTVDDNILNKYNNNPDFFHVKITNPFNFVKGEL
jgi:predicted nucleic acid-binding protein